MVPKPPQTAAQIAAEALLRANEASAIAHKALAVNVETNAIAKEIRAALLEPLPGYDKSFVARTTEVVVGAEAGQIVGEKLVWYAKVLGALGAIATAIYGAVHWGPTR
jgi:hypothetical protein